MDSYEVILREAKAESEGSQNVLLQFIAGLQYVPMSLPDNVCLEIIYPKVVQACFLETGQNSIRQPDIRHYFVPFTA